MNYVRNKMIFPKACIISRKKEISALENDIQRQLQRNSIISLKLMKKEGTPEESDERSSITQHSFNDLDAKIKQEQDQIAKIQKEIKDITEKGNERVRILEEKLRQIPGN